MQDLREMSHTQLTLYTFFHKNKKNEKMKMRYFFFSLHLFLFFFSSDLQMSQNSSSPRSHLILYCQWEKISSYDERGMLGEKDGHENEI